MNTGEMEDIEYGLKAADVTGLSDLYYRKEKYLFRMSHKKNYIVQTSH